MPCIALFGDNEPTDTTEALKDMNQVIPLSPTGSVQGIFGMGDMTKSTGTMIQTMNALDASSLKDVPHYFVIGNHEYDSRSSTYPLIQKHLKAVNPISKWSGDSTGNTYYTNIDRLNIWNLNIYSVKSGGAVSQEMYEWLDTYTKAALGYKIVLAHDPMYPTAKHVGNSLDADINMRNKLQAMFIRNKVNAFVGGHVHYSTVQNIDGIFHICSGVIGGGITQGEDKFATINYIFIDQSGNLVLQRTQEINNSWSNPKKLLTIIGTGGLIQTPTPIITPTPFITPTPVITPTPSPENKIYLFSINTFPDGALLKVNSADPNSNTPIPDTITPTPIPATPTAIPFTPKPITPTPKPATPTPKPAIPKMTDLEKIKTGSGKYKVLAEVYNYTTNTKVEFWDGNDYKSTASKSPFYSKEFTIDHTITAKLYEGNKFLESHKENFTA